MANCVGICTDNYLDQATVVESSANTVYPASNVLDIQRRKKVWRTAGYFLVVSGDNTIVFRENAGVDLTATVAAAGYATPALFAAAVKAALEAVGDSTYTVEHLVSGKFRITAVLAGGATVFQLRWADAGSADMAAVLGFDTTNLTGALNYTADEVRIHTEEFLVMDLGIASSPKAFCLVGDRNNPLRISNTATIKLMGNHTGNFTSPAFEITIPYSEYALAVWNFDGISTTAYRYWKFQIIDRDNPRLYLEFGAAFLGEMLDFTRGCAVYPLQLRGIDRSELVVSEGGQVFGLRKPKTMGIGLSFKGLLIAEEEELRGHWEEVGITDNFFLILDAQDAFSTLKEDRVKLVRFAEEFQEQLVSPNNFEANLELVEAI